MNTNKQINTVLDSDVVFATVTQRGSVLTQLKLQGLSSMDELMKKLMSSLSAVKGIITIEFRNFTQGWNQRRALVLR